MRKRDLIEDKRCKHCQKEIANIKTYCDNICQSHYQTEKKIKIWLSGKSIASGKTLQIPRFIRRYLINESGNKCSKCGWSEVNPCTNTVPLDVDHIDGNANNNLKSNLRVLCPNCHSLTCTYKNSGSRKSSRIR